MKFYIKILLISIIAFLTSCEDYDKKKMDVANSNFDSNLKGSFQDNFSITKEFELDSLVQIGKINYIDVDDDIQRLLITDCYVNQVVLFDTSGKFLKYLRPDKCNPGLHWSPICAKYIGDQIVVLNNSPWGYKFKLDGECVGPMDATFLPPKYISAYGKENIIGFYNNANSKYTLSILDLNGKIQSSFSDIDFNYDNFIYRVDGGGLVIDGDKNIYLMNVVEPKIYKYNSDFNLISEFVGTSKKFKKLENDFSPNTFKSSIPSIASSLYLLNKKIIIIEIQHEKGYNILLMDLNGKMLNNTEYSTEYKLLCVKKNHLFFSYYPVLGKSISGNPKILVYRFNPSLQD